MKIKIPSHAGIIFALVMGCDLPLTRADMIPGVDWHVANAEVVALVQAETAEASKVFPPPDGQQRVRVREILKGVDTAQTLFLPAGTLSPGQTGVALFEYQHPASYEPAIETSRQRPGGEASSGISVWPINAAGKVDTRGIYVDTVGGPGTQRESDPIAFDEIKKAIATSSPEQIGLNGQVLDAALFPEKFQALAKRDAGRATYVEFVTAILDMNRDVPALARLLESGDPAVRAAALKKLETLTHADISPPPNDSPRALGEWSRKWSLHVGAKKSSRWPVVPADLKIPPDAFPAPLIQALETNDASAFSEAFAAWLDSGVVRDREIHFAATLDRKIVEGSHLGGGIGQSGPYLPPAPRLNPEVILNPKIPATDRAKAIALFAQIFHYDHFANERAAAISRVEAAPGDSDIPRRAAFWELRDVNIETAGGVALERLSQDDADEQAQNFLLHVCLAQFDDEALGAIRAEIKAGQQTFVAGLFAYLEGHQDHNAQFVARLLCQEKQPQVVPVMLGWLNLDDAEARKSAALNLCWFPSPVIVPNLLDAIHSERDPEVKAQMLVALAQTGDSRGLKTLLAAAQATQDLNTAGEIMRGLGRIRDPKALPILSDMVAKWAWVINEDGKLKSDAPSGSPALLSDAANAFGYISGLYEAPAPDEFGGSSGIETAKLKSAVARVEQWRKSRDGK